MEDGGISMKGNGGAKGMLVCGKEEEVEEEEDGRKRMMEWNGDGVQGNSKNG